MFTNLLFFQLGSLVDYAFYFLMLAQSYRLMLRVNTILILTFLSCFFTCLAFHMGNQWLNNLSGNASFPYFQGLTLNVFLTLIHTSTINQVSLKTL